MNKMNKRRKIRQRKQITLDDKVIEYKTKQRRI